MNSELATRNNMELVTIYEISKILSSSLDLSRTLREALNVLVTHMDYQRAILVTEESAGQLSIIGAAGLTSEERAAGRYQVGEGVIGRVFSTGMQAVVHDISKEPIFLNRTGGLTDAASGIIAMVAVPVRTGQEILGVLSIFRNRRSHAGFQQDTRLLTMVGSLIGQAMALERAVNDEHERLLGETRQLAKALKGRYKLDNVVGVSKRMQEVFAEVHQVGPSRSTVLLRGESGTGKEVIARSIHELSPRKNKPFIKVNCAALTESLLESELFGHEKGAYTGAVGERRGRFELADGGTLFLDEIGDISPAFQAKLLRVLQEREFERVGGSRPIKVDVRLICATNRNLEKMVAAGEFRADLYYRINVVSLFLPPLRERREDIPPLIAYFVERFNKENGRELRVSPEALNVLVNCYWPGNVRELENCIERTSTMARGDVIQDVNFPCHNNRCLTQTLHHIDKDDAVAPARMPVEAVVVAPPVSTRPPHYPAQPAQPFQPPEPPERQFGSEKPESERERLVWAMEQSGWVQAKAARLLNITPRQMGYALQKYNIEVRRF